MSDPYAQLIAYLTRIPAYSKDEALRRLIVAVEQAESTRTATLMRERAARMFRPTYNFKEQLREARTQTLDGKPIPAVPQEYDPKAKGRNRLAPSAHPTR